jgi:1-deoxy-D-xylulose-5-phosphate synthase
VELSIALHRVFDSPREPIIFDTGHQSYVHKILTGRAEGFDRLRQEGGLSGYPSRQESEHDLVENQHASTSLSYADGLAKAFAIRGRGPRRGGGDRRRRAHRRHGLGGAQQHRGRQEPPPRDRGQRQRPLLHPDRRRLAEHLTALRTNPRYEQILDASSVASTACAASARRCTTPARHEEGHEGRARAAGLFEDLGLKYVGPIDGHDRTAVEQALAQAKRFGGPVIVHVMTRKGFGYDPAERHEADQFHQIGPFDVETGVGTPKGRIWTDFFSEEMVASGPSARTSSRSRRPCSTRSASTGSPRRTPTDLRRRHRRAARRHQCSRPRLAGLHPVSRSTPPSSTGPSTRS